MKALNEDAVSEVLYHSSQMILFRNSTTAVWHQTNASLVPKKMLAKALLKRPNIEITCTPKESEVAKIAMGSIIRVNSGRSGPGYYAKVGIGQAAVDCQLQN